MKNILFLFSLVFLLFIIGSTSQDIQPSAIETKNDTENLQLFSHQNQHIKAQINDIDGDDKLNSSPQAHSKDSFRGKKVSSEDQQKDNQIQESNPQDIEEEIERYREYELSFNEKCNDDSECDAKQMCTQGHCQRRSILPLSFPEIFGSVVIITILGFGQAAGVGGGTSITPILLALFLYDTKKSVAIVIVLVFSGSLGNIVQLSRERTNDGVPVIDYRLILVTLPTLIVGTVYGVAINKFLPPLIVCILLVILLAQQISKTYIRYKNMRDKELKLLEINAILHEGNQEHHQHQVQIHHESHQSNIHNFEAHKMTPLLDLTASDQGESKQVQAQELQLLVKEEYELYPKDTIKQICAVSLFVIIFSLLRGGSKFDSLLGIPACGLVYQMMNMIIAITFYKWIQYIINDMNIVETKKENLGYNFPHGKLTLKAMQEYAKTGFLAGFLGGMLGIGGGIILIPRWLEYGISSTRTTACTLTIVCFTTFNSFFQLYLSGSYTVEEIVFFSLLALLSSFICRGVKAYVKKTKRDSILILILSIFMALATTLLSGIIVYHAIQNFEDSTKFGRFC